MRRYLSIFAALILLPAGCSSESYKTASVSGRVTLNGEPLANAAVVFQPVAPEGNANPGPGSGGFTDADGRYTLKITKPNGQEIKGAVVGKHKVMITMKQTDDSADDKAKRPKPPVKLPPKISGKDTKLEFDVPSGGTDSADFPLTSH
jgi:hypothetical protein